MRQAPIKKLRLLGDLRLPPATAVPDALFLVEELIPGIGSLLLWGGPGGDVAGGYSTLVGMELGLAHYAEQFGNTERERQYGGSTFKEGLGKTSSAERLFDVLQMPRAEFRRSDVYRVMMAPYGIEDLIRVVVTDHGRPLGGLVVFRGDADPPFQHRELKMLDEIGPLVGAILRNSEATAIPVIAAGRPSHAILDSERGLSNMTADFRQHLVMLNQLAPGMGACKFEVELPEQLAGRLHQLTGCPHTLGVTTAWGRFQLYVDRFLDSNQHSLVAVRMLPINLQMFRSLLDLALSERQLQVACGLAEGQTFNEIAANYGISRNSIITHVTYLYDKLAVSTRDELLHHYVWSSGLKSA